MSLRRFCRGRFGRGRCRLRVRIDRIDLLLDGASATYGSDAIGGVFNIILKRAFDGAIKLLTANAADYPKSASAQFGLARAYKTSGDLGQARVHFQKALEIDPNFKKASDGLNALK